MPAPRRVDRRGFTLVEALISTVITVLCGSALLLGVSSSIKTTNDALYAAVAAGIAQQMMNEIAGKRYCGDPSVPYQYPLGPNAYEASGVCRERYDDIDDYQSVTAQPPKDRWGVAIGSDDGQGGMRDPNFRINANMFAQWQEVVSVYYVNASNKSQALPAGQTSDCRAVEVKINFRDPVQGTRQLTALRQVFTYVPTP